MSPRWRQGEELQVHGGEALEVSGRGESAPLIIHSPVLPWLLRAPWAAVRCRRVGGGAGARGAQGSSCGDEHEMCPGTLNREVYFGRTPSFSEPPIPPRVAA